MIWSTWVIWTIWNFGSNHPGSDPTQIELETGGKTLTLLEDGRLKVSMDGAEMLLSKPFAYQTLNGDQVPVTVAYSLLPDAKLGFQLGAYDASQPLTIDPTLTWSTYLGSPGGAGTELGQAIAVDASGNAYLTGNSSNADFPLTPGAYNESYSGGGADVFVTKLNATGSALVYSTFVGGSSHDYAYGLALDSSNNVYVTGSTESSDFPTTGGVLNETYSGGVDGFVFKLNTDGSALTYSTYLGGSMSDQGNAITVDSMGNVFVAGQTDSSDFPTTSGVFMETLGGSTDAFICELNSAGTALSFSTFLGGSSDDLAHAIAIDASGNAYVTGETSSSDFPTTGSAFDMMANGGKDIFVAKFNSTGTSLTYSSYLGDSADDIGRGIAVDGSGNAYVTGVTQSSSFPTTMGAYDETYNGNGDVFVTRFSSDGSSLTFSSFIGSMFPDDGYAIALDSAGNAYITGEASFFDFPTTPGAFDTSSTGQGGFALKLSNDGSNLVYSTFIAGGISRGLALDSSDNAFITGRAEDGAFPATSGAFSESIVESIDAFALKLSDDGSSLGYATFLGGSEEEFSLGVALDSLGDVYVTGIVESNNFPTTPGAYDQSYNEFNDVFVSKLTGDGTSLAYSTFIGGSGTEEVFTIVVDASGNAYIGGQTTSNDFPTTAGALIEMGDGDDGYVCKLNADGSDLVFSTFLGGSSFDSVVDLSLDSSGNVVAVGYTFSSTFPTTSGAYQETKGSGIDSFVSKLNSDGSSLIFSTFVGGSSADFVRGLALDGADNIYVIGFTTSGFPTTSGAFQETPNGGTEMFVFKMLSDGSALSYATYLGGSGSDQAKAIAVNAAGHAFALGQSLSSDFPTTSGAYDESANGGRDGVISQLSADGSSLVFSSYLGGSDDDYPAALALDGLGNILIAGRTASSDFPTTTDAFSQTYQGEQDCVLVGLSNAGSTLLYGSYYGGTDYESFLAMNYNGTLVLSGESYSVDFPTTSGAYDETQNGYGDAIVMKVSLVLDQPGAITGNDELCANATNEVYFITAVPGATGYTWTVPPGAMITSGQGTFAIAVDFGTSSGDVTVTANNAFGPSVASVLPVTVYTLPGQPGSISGNTSVCPNETSLTYSVNPVDQATEYTWTVPTGASIQSGQGSESIMVDFGSTAGDVTVTPSNVCGSGPAQTLAVSITAIPNQPASISGETMVCENDLGIAYSIDPVMGASSYTWSVPTDALIASGQGTSSILVNFGLDSGQVSVTANNECGSSSAQSVSVAVLEPVQVLTSFPDLMLCTGDMQSFSVSASGSPMLSYQWLLDGKPIIDGGNYSGATTDTLTINPVSLAEAGLYACEVSNFCTVESSNTFQLTVADQLVTWIAPTSAAQGLNPLTFTVTDQCGALPLSYQWTDLTSGAMYTGNPLVLPVVTQTTDLEVVVTDQNLATTTHQVLILWHAAGNLDLNNDGCNTVDDLGVLYPFWTQIYVDDPNGDSRIDIRDFLYINTDETGICPL
ncbi:MAG: SBBP repeat-containing protein [Acidobacteria bacterium]|nr:SBBP repeat-containing protein [Acidobacteriota bacterium]